MKNQRLLVALTAINLGLLTYQVLRPRFAMAQETRRCSVARPGDRR